MVNFIADRVCVMFLGKICEIGNTDDIFENPLHPYTKLLLDAIPSIENAGRQKETQSYRCSKRLQISYQMPVLHGSLQNG